jgi:hypothetical protein
VFATGGEENLRIVRGAVDLDLGAGTFRIGAGSGFTFSHEGTRRFRITFTTPFAGRPVVTGSAQEITCPPWVIVNSITTSSVLIGVECESGPSNHPFCFIAVGPR